MNITTRTLLAGLLGLAVGISAQSTMAKEAESGGNHEGEHHGKPGGDDRYNLSGPWMVLYKFPSATTNKAPVKKIIGVATQTDTNFTFVAAGGTNPVMTGTIAARAFTGSYYDTNNTAGHIEFAGKQLNHQVIAGTAHQVEDNQDGKFMAIRLHK